MKVPVSALLLPLLGGAVFCWYFVGTRYRFERRDGYHFFFMAAIAGTGLLALSYSGLRLLELGDPRLEGAFAAWDTFAPPVPYLGTCIGALLLAWPCAMVLNSLVDGESIRRSEILQNGDEFEQMLMQAITTTYTAPQLYMATMSTGKVYVGMIMSDNDLYGRRKYLTILKFASGYRDENQQVTLTTQYAKILQQLGRRRSGESISPPLPEHVTEADFEVVLPKSKVIALSRFEPEAREYFPDGPAI